MSQESQLPHPPLSLVEARVLGCLIEKEATTPDSYPLTLNALVNACNQKSNRHPVLELDEGAVATALESLRRHHLAMRVSQAEARVAKFKHSLENVYPIPEPQQAILAELLLRGAQTAGELRARSERICPIDTLEAVREELGQMTDSAIPLALELPRQPGKKDARYAHLLSGTPEISNPTPAVGSEPLKVAVAMTLPPEAEERIGALEATVASQAQALETLRSEFAEFRAQFE